jgi:hypothetical protein
MASELNLCVVWIATVVAVIMYNFQCLAITVSQVCKLWWNDGSRRRVRGQIILLYEFETQS